MCARVSTGTLSGVAKNENDDDDAFNATPLRDALCGDAGADLEKGARHDSEAALCCSEKLAKNDSTPLIDACDE